MAINVSPLEVVVLKKLVVVNHALAGMIDGTAAAEQRALVQVLNDVALRADLDTKRVSAPRHPKMNMSVECWLSERLDNCHRIAATKTGADREGWLVDALYFSEALDALAKAAEAA